MGCASSKQMRRCRHCQAPGSPIPRSYSMHVHHPSQHGGDSYHVVALTSTTLGSLKLDSNHQINGGNINVSAFNANLDTAGGKGNPKAKINGNVKQVDGDEEEEEEEQGKGLGGALELIEAKVWSKMIADKIPKVIPKTPITTPPGEPETINAWEMMAGLEDFSPLRSPPCHFRSFSFDVVKNNPTPPNPMWLQMDQRGDDDHDHDHDDVASNDVDFDPRVISNFKKSLQQLPPDNPFHLRSQQQQQEDDQNICSNNNKVYKDRLVVYFTSLRGVRKTYEDCCHVRVILKGLGVRVDERDVSMHSGFKDELKELMGEGFRGGLPRVFVGKNYIGGAEEIKRMHEEGQLEKVVEGCEMVDNNNGAGGNAGGVCEACGDVRFVPCETCSGSCKVYYEEEDYDDDEEEREDQLEEEEEEGGEYGFQRCPDCNENGLIRCPICCY